MIRTFLALFPPVEQQQDIKAFIRVAAPLLPDLRCVSPENLHFTLRFFGDLGDRDRETVIRVVDAIAAEAVPFPVDLETAGVFPHWNRARVFWLGVSRGRARMTALVNLLDRGFREAGLGPADKPFKAHLTLGRWRYGASISREDQAQLVGSVEKISFTASELRMVGSTLSPGGPTYRALHEVSFGSRR